MDIINPHRFSTAAPAVDFDGFGNASRYFDGVDDFVNFGDSDDFSFGDSVNDSPFSVSAWVKAVDISAFRVLSKFSFTTAEWLFGFDDQDHLIFYIWDSTFSNQRGAYTNTVYTSLENTWIHIAATYDGRGGNNAGDGVKLYLNGSEVTNLTRPVSNPYTAMHNTSLDLMIGVASNNSVYSNGHVADARLYNSELSSTDIAALYGGENITTNLIGHWLKDTPSLLDHSGTNDGTNEGSAFSYDNPSPAVEFGKASRVFNGTSDYIEASNTVSIGTGSISWSAWAKAPNTATGTYPDTIARVGDLNGAGNASYDGLHLLFYQSKLTVYFADFTNYGGDFIYQTSYTYNANQWYHLCGVLNASTQKLELYVDGVLDGSVDISAAYPWNLTATKPPSIGARKTGASYNHYYTGNLADVRLYDSVLSSTDALALYNGTNVETNLIGHWLTNTDDVKDYAGVNDGTNFGSTYSFDNPLSEGEFGSASREFDLGTDYVDFGNSTDFDLTSTLTMSFWINPDTAHNGGIFSKWTTGAGTDNSYTCYLGQDSGNSRVTFILQQSTAPRIRLDSDIDLPLNEWSHICCVADGTNMRIYINGALNVSTTYDGTIKVTTKKLITGRLREEDNLYPFDGNIADVRLYDAGLLAQDIFDISRGYDYRTNLVGHWLTNKDDVDDYAGTNHGTNNGSIYSQDAPL